MDFADAIGALEDELGMTLVDESADEERFVTVGMDVLGQILVVVYAPRGEKTTRIISARKATPRERRTYEGEK